MAPGDDGGITPSQEGATASFRSEGSAAVRPASPGSQDMTESLDNLPPIVLGWGRTGSNHGPPCA